VYDRLASLPLEIESYNLERLELRGEHDFARVTTTVVMRGGGVEGRGEDVTYTPSDHDGYPGRLPLDGRRTLEEHSRLLEDCELFPNGASMQASVDYRRWAFESATLDLALRQNGLTLGGALGREYRRVRFVMSTRHEIEPWLEANPDLEFKLDPTSDWTDARMRKLAALNRVRVLDLKGQYEGTPVDQAPDPRLYHSVATLLPDAIIEDPALNDATREALHGSEDRWSWDAPIHSLDDIRALERQPRFLNIKPSRFGALSRLLETISWCEQNGVVMYGGGQLELGVGRLQIQTLASLFYPDGPNDVAPAVYNEGDPAAELPHSPLDSPTAL
jgi:L-alanine-DL-glutamate epimerase-like enolase superfamily enzyme